MNNIESPVPITPEQAATIELPRNPISRVRLLTALSRQCGLNEFIPASDRSFFGDLTLTRKALVETATIAEQLRS